MGAFKKKIISKKLFCFFEVVKSKFKETSCETLSAGRQNFSVLERFSKKNKKVKEILSGLTKIVE